MIDQVMIDVTIDDPDYRGRHRAPGRLSRAWRKIRSWL